MWKLLVRGTQLAKVELGYEPGNWQQIRVSVFGHDPMLPVIINIMIRDAARLVLAIKCTDRYHFFSFKSL